MDSSGVLIAISSLSRCVFRSTILFFTLFLSNVCQATDWYWVNDGGGVWDDNLYFSNWQDSDGNTPATSSGEPGAGDSAFLVLPYQFSFCDGTGYCLLQPVSVYYRSETSPALQSIAIESWNQLYQWYGLGIEPEYLNLTTNIEYVGGAPYAYDPPPGYHIDPSVGIYPRGEHIQNAGTNRVDSLLQIGGAEGSTGLYRLERANDAIFGTLSVGTLEVIGAEGSGIFEQSGGVHAVDSTLVMGQATTGSGAYLMTGGTLSAATEVVGSSGYAEFTQRGGEHTADLLTIGEVDPGQGIYRLSGTGTLNAATEIIGKGGKGSFFQAGGTHNVDTLTLGAEAGGNGSYTLDLGTLNVASTITLGASGGIAGFVQNGGIANVGSFTQPAAMTIGGAGGTVGEYTMNDGQLDLIGETKIWENSSFTQTGGNHRPTRLSLRTGASYNLEGGSLVVVQWDADGNVVHTGGEASVSTLTLGELQHLVMSPSEYLLEDAGAIPAPSLTVNTEGLIGRQNEGIFTQRGADSRATFTNLYVGAGVASGTYNLEGGSLEVTGKESIGWNSDGTFNQTGGTHKVLGDLVVGDAEVGLFDLQSAPLLRVQGDTVIGHLATGTFNNSASHHHVEGDLLLGNEFIILPSGSADIGRGHYTLGNFGLLEVDGTERVGVIDAPDGLGSTFTQESGGHTVAVDLAIGENSTFIHNGGFVWVTRDLTGNAGSSYSMNNDAELVVSTNAMFGGSFNLVNGNFEVLGNAALSGYNQSGGEAIISGSFQATGELSAGRLEAATHDVSNFTQTGGDHVVHGDMTIGGGSQATIGGSGNLSAGKVTIAGFPGASNGTFAMQGASYVTATDGIENAGLLSLTGAGKKKTIDANLTNSPRGHTEVSTTIAGFNGGILNDATDDGAGLISIGTSVVDVNGRVTNSSYIDIDADCNSAGILCGIDNSSKAEILINDSFVQFNDNVSNYGIVRITDSVIHGTIYEGGDESELIIDPSDVYFSTITFSEDATLKAGPGDRIFIEKDFNSRSLHGTVWDTAGASLIFNGIGLQNFDLAGIDLGVDPLGYQNNFAWNELIVGSGIDLNLWDGNSDEGAALYVGVLRLESGVDLESLLIDYIFSDFNIYYDSTRQENSYLQGFTFALNGNGFLMPSNVPVPPSVWLFGSGLIGLLAVARRRSDLD